MSSSLVIMLIFILGSLLTCILMASYALHLGISNQIYIRSKLTPADGQMLIPVNQSEIEELEKEADKAINDIENAQFDGVDETIYQAGPIL